MTKKPITHLMLISAVLCLTPLVLSAQQNNFESRLRSCASIDEDGKRLACYDQILSPDIVTNNTKLPPGSDVVTPSQAQADAVEATPSQTQSQVLQEEQVDADKFGLKQKQPRETQSITVTVNGIRKNLSDHFVYTTTDGQVWVQIDTRKPRYDEVPFIAEIRTASLGSFFLKPSSYGYSIRVRREK
jgi:hypothetical protein